MSLDEQIPYDEPSEAEWNEMAHVVFDELDGERAASDLAPATSSRRAWPWLAAIGVAAAALVGFALLRPAPLAPSPTPQTTRLPSTDAPSHATLGEVQVELAADSSGVAVGNDVQGWVVTLERGRAVFSVPPRRDRPPFVVQAGEVRVQVIGTRFGVTREDERVGVDVEHGAVRVTTGGRSVELRAGDDWTSIVEEPSAPVPEDPVEIASTTSEPQATTEAASPPLDAAALFQRASALEARDPARAARMYADISRRGGRWSGAALFARGRLEMDRGNRDTAQMLLRRYLRRHPDGLNARDAREMLNRLEIDE